MMAGTPALDRRSTPRDATRRPTTVSVEQHELDGLRIDLATLRADAIATCDYVEPRLDWMVPVSIELGPTAYQVVIGCLHSIGRLRRRAAGAGA
jgi:hypothetical protein